MQHEKITTFPTKMKREMGKAHSLAVKCIDKMRNKLLEKFYISCCLSKSMPIPQ